MPEPDLIQRQREILRTFRQATGRRTDVEAGAEARRKAECEAADTALNKAHQEAETRRTKAAAEAEAHCRVEHEGADYTLNKVQQSADAQLAEVHRAQEETQAALAKVSLQHLLKYGRPVLPVVHPSADPAQELAHSVLVATEVAQGSLSTSSISESVEALQRSREAAQKRFIVLGIVSFLIVGILVLFLLLLFTKG